MDLRINKPKTVAAALKPFKVALADLQAVVKAKRLVVSNADAAMAQAGKAQAAAGAAADKKRDEMNAAALAVFNKVTSTQTAAKTGAEAEIAEADVVLGKLSDLLGLK